MVTDYAAASVASAVRSDNPEALEELRANLDAMKTELQRLAQLSQQDSSAAAPQQGATMLGLHRSMWRCLLAFVATL